MTTSTSRVFNNGNSQAVRIPQEFRLQSSRVEVSRNQDGDLIIHPIPENRGTELLDALSGFDDDYIDILEQDREQSQALQDRDSS